MFRLVSTPVLLGVVAWGAFAGVSLAPDGPDTSRAVADRLRVGMTLDDALAAVGAPPGDYRVEGDRVPFYFGFTLPYGTVRYRWTSYRGSIQVVASATPSQIVRDTAGRVVQSVEWSPVGQHPFWWRLRSPLAVIAVGLAGLLLVLWTARAVRCAPPGHDSLARQT